MRKGTRLYHFLFTTGRNTTQNAPKLIILSAKNKIFSGEDSFPNLSPDGVWAPPPYTPLFSAPSAPQSSHVNSAPADLVFPQKLARPTILTWRPLCVLVLVTLILATCNVRLAVYRPCTPVYYCVLHAVGSFVVLTCPA